MRWLDKRREGEGDEVVVVRRKWPRLGCANFKLPSTPIPLSQHTMATQRRFTCFGCYKDFSAERHLLSHKRQARYSGCNDRYEDAELDDTPMLDDFDRLSDDPPAFDGIDTFSDELDANLDNFEVRAARERAKSPTPAPPSASADSPPQRIPAPPQPTHDCDTIDGFPDAGKVLRQEKAVFDRWQQSHMHSDNPYFPFKNKLDWEVARWSKQEGPSASSLDRLLACESVCCDTFVLETVSDVSLPRSQRNSTFPSPIPASSIKLSTTNSLRLLNGTP